MKLALSIICVTISAGFGASIAPMGQVWVANAESPPLGILEEFQIHIEDTVYFEAGSFVLSPLARQTLHRQALFLLEHPSTMVKLSGNAADIDGGAATISNEDAFKLGEKRAVEAREYLISQGVHSHRILIESNGRERPRLPGNEEASYAENRNVFTQLVAFIIN